MVDQSKLQGLLEAWVRYLTSTEKISISMTTENLFIVSPDVFTAESVKELEITAVTNDEL